MSKNSMKKATIADFLAKKLKREEDRTKTCDITISSMGKTITVKKPSDNDILNFIDSLGDTKSTKKIIEENMKLIYNNCPDLQDVELHQNLEIKDPYDMVLTDVIFDFKDKQEIMEQFTDFIGVKADKIDEEIKN